MSLPISLLLNKDYSFSQSDLLAFRDMLRKREPAPPTLTEKIEGKKKELASMETMQDRDLDASSTSALAERIKEAKKELQDTEAEQAEQQRLEGERALLPSPIGCTPTGILATIFLSVSEGSNSSLLQIFGKLLALTGRVTLSHPSVKLSHVCSDWRELALRTPQLWSKMDVKLPGFYPTLSYDEWCARVEAEDRWPDEDDIGQVELILQAGHELKKLTLYHESISSRSELSQCLKQLSSLVNLKLCRVRDALEAHPGRECRVRSLRAFATRHMSLPRKTGVVGRQQLYKERLD